jgi:hypothetical protein
MYNLRHLKMNTFVISHNVICNTITYEQKNPIDLVNKNGTPNMNDIPIGRILSGVKEEYSFNALS